MSGTAWGLQAMAEASSGWSLCKNSGVPGPVWPLKLKRWVT